MCGGPDGVEEILSLRVARTVAADHTVSWQGQRWGLRREDVCAGMRGAHAEIERRLDGSHWLRFRGRYLPLQPCLEPPLTSTPHHLPHPPVPLPNPIPKTHKQTTP